METIKNFNINEQEEAEDPLVTLWGIFYTEIIPTGRMDYERSAFKSIEARILSKEISGKEGIEEARAIVNGRQE